LVVEGNYSPEDAKTLIDNINEAYSGEGNQGKMVTIVKELRR